MTALNLKDGVRDGHCQPSPITRPGCGHTVCRTFNRCLFCGRVPDGGSPFDTA